MLLKLTQLFVTLATPTELHTVFTSTVTTDAEQLEDEAHQPSAELAKLTRSCFCYIGPQTPQHVLQ